MRMQEARGARRWSSFLALLVGGAAIAGPAAPAWASGEEPKLGYRDVCPFEDGHRRCDIKMRTDEEGAIKYDSSPVGGYAPADLESAYGLTPTDGAGKIVALYGGNSDYTNGESDLGVYRAQYGLPPCTASNGCFIRIDEHGGTNYPAAGTDETEQSLDIEMASASCPACKIMLIEGPDMDIALATAVSRGGSAFCFSVLLGVGGATGTECQNLGFNSLSGILVSGALGDTAYPGARDFIPATCQGALAVGGTTLDKATNARGWTETTWSGTGSGCSPYVAKPAWQTDTGCAMRMEGDIAAVADPNTGMSVYNTQGGGGWGVVGGTSAASPLVAGSLTSLGIANGHFSPAWVRKNAENFFDITTGNNGTCAGSPSYFCTAGTGFDGPTGWGTINGNLLKSALPPGVTIDAGAACAQPTGSYSATCTDCVTGIRDIGCALACESCTKIDGSQNPGPVVALPCGGDISNQNGSLECSATGVADAGADSGGGSDAGGAEGNDGGGAARDAGQDASSVRPPSLEGGIVLASEGGAGADGGQVELADDGGLGDASPPASSGCGCATAGRADTRTGPHPLAIAIGAAFVLAFRRRPQRRREPR